jgi:hypothetical protein
VSPVENGTPKKDGASGLIPEIYYDLIARISPSVLIIVLLFAPFYKEIEGLTSLKLTDFTFVIILIGFGYLVGHLLTTISLALNLILWDVFLFRFKRSLRKKLIYQFQSNSVIGIFAELYQRIDWVAKEDNSGGVILKKMEAGSALTDNLLSGWIIIVFCYNVFPKYTTLMFNPLKNLLVVSSISTLLLLSSIFRRLALILRQEGLLKLLHFKGIN